MYEIINTQGIILLERIDREYDKIFFILSREFGFISVKTPGILKSGAKLKSLIQPYRIISGDIVVGKSSHTLISVQEAHSFEGMLYDVQKRRIFARVLEFLVAVVPRYVSVPEIYDVFITCITHLSEKTNKHELIYIEQYVLYTALTLLGYIDDEDNLSGNFFIPENFFCNIEKQEILLHRVQLALKEIHT